MQKLAVVSHYENSAIDILMDNYIPYFRKHFEVTKFNTGDDKERHLYEEFDLVHFGWVMLAPDEVVPPCTANVWNVSLRQLNQYGEKIFTLHPEKLIVDDIMTMQILGQLGFSNVVEIPLAFGYEPGEIPYPDEFTIGYFGNNYASKRFSAIDTAAAMADVNIAGFKLDKNRTKYFLEPKEIYEQMSVYVHASFSDTNSMPVMEALRCGRPVICTRNYGLQRVVRPGINGFWFDGSPEDLVKKIEQVKPIEYSMREAARTTCLPSPEKSAEMYVEVFNAILDSE